MNEQLGWGFPYLFCAVVAVIVATFIFTSVVMRPTLAFACPSSTYINDETVPPPPPPPPATTRSINPDTQALSKQCEKGKQYKIRILTDEELARQPKYRCIGPINEFGSQQPVAIDVTWQNGIEPGQPPETLPEATVSFQIDLEGKKFISIYCREGNDLKKEFEKNPFTNGFAREARNRGLDEEVDALALAYERGRPLEIKQAASNLVNKGLNGIYDGFESNPSPTRSELLKDQVFINHLEKIAAENNVTTFSRKDADYDTNQALKNARAIIANDLEKFAVPGAPKRLDPEGRFGSGPKTSPTAPKEPPAETKSGESTFPKTSPRAPATLDEAADRVERAHKAYEESCWFDGAWCSSQKEAELVVAQKVYREMHDRENPTANETTTGKKISGISQPPGEKGYDPSIEFEGYGATQRTQPPDDPSKKLRDDIERLRRENEALRQRGGGRTPPPGSDLWRLLLGGGSATQNSACTEAAYRLCVTPPHHYQACMACSQGGPGGQGQNPLQQLIGNIAKLFGAQGTDPISQAMCAPYPGTQFMNGNCQCPQGTQWVASTAGSPYNMSVQYPYTQPNPYTYPYTQPNPYASPYGYPGTTPYGGYPTGSCQRVNVCAQYPGTQLVNNQCTCPAGQQWNGTTCVAAAPAPVEQVKAELSCSSRVVDAGTPLSLSWSCINAGTSRADGFDTAGALSGSKELKFEGADSNGNPVPPFNLTLTCEKGGKTAVAQCPLEINHPIIVAAAAPSIVARGEKTNIGWIVKGMKEGNNVCTITSNKHAGFSITGRNTVIETPPITELTKFKIRCTTRGENTKEAEVVINIKN